MAKTSSRHNVQTATLRGTILLSLLAAFPAASFAQETEASPNFVTFIFGGSSVDGDSTTFQSRQQMRDGYFGGIDALHFETALSEGMDFTLDGRSIFDNKDYSIEIGLKKKDVFSFKFEVENFRKWYDGGSQEFQANGMYFTPRLDTYAIDRSKFVADFTLELPDLPKINLKYTHTERDGSKPSTITADTSLTAGGAPIFNNSLNRNFAPSDYGINEKRDTFEIKGTYEIESTGTGLEAGIVMDKSEVDNSFYFTRSPFTSTDRKVTQNNYNNTNLFAVHGIADQKYSENLRLTTSALWTTLDGDIRSSRIYGATYDAPFTAGYAGAAFRDHGYYDLVGTSRMEQFVGTFNLLYTPVKGVSIVPAIRFERTWEKAADSYVDTSVGSAPAFAMSQSNIANWTNQDYSSVTGSLEARYNGIKNWLFYAESLYGYGEGNLMDDTTGQATPNLEEVQCTSIKLVAGTNWQVYSGLKLAVQAYHKFDRTLYVSSSQHERRVNDINARATWRIAPKLTSITRFDYQLADNFNKDYPSIDSLNSAARNRYIYSESISFQPMNRLSLQTSASYVQDKLVTPASGELFVVADAAVKGNFITEPLARIYASNQDYWTLSATAVYAVSDDTDLTMTYSAYVSDNFYDNSYVSLPLGNNTEEQSLVTTITKSFSPNLVLTLQYGIYGYSDEMTGYHTDYLAHVVSTKLQYRF